MIEQVSKSMKMAVPVKAIPGSWGDVPAPQR